jgi:FkbM family methyltransferase
MKKKLVNFYYFLFDLQCKLLGLFLSHYAFFSYTAKKLIFSPTIRQLRAADRNLMPRNIKKYRVIFDIFGIPKKNGAILDVGANLGYSALAFRLALQNNDIDIYSFEPYPLNIRFLSKNVRGNNIKVIPMGLGNFNQTLDIGFPDYTKTIINNDDRLNTGRISFVGLNSQKQAKKMQQAKIVNGDSYLRKKMYLKKILFVKIDVEGYEIEVLKGLKKTLIMNRPLVQMEANLITMRLSRTSFSDIKKFAITCNYKIYILCKKSLVILGEGWDKTSLPNTVNEFFFIPKERHKLTKEIFFV